MKALIRSAAAVSLLALAIPALAQPASPATAASAQTAEGAKLHKLFQDSDEAQLKRSPISAIFRGDLRYADSIGDNFTDTSYNEMRRAATSEMERLRAIDRAKLNPTDQIAYDVFQWQTQDTLNQLRPDLLVLTQTQPVDHFTGFHTFYPGFASGQGAAPFKTLKDYEDNLKRHHQYAATMDVVLMRFRQGIASGVVQPKLVVNNMIDQLNNLLPAKVEDSVFYGPVTKFPEGIAAADQARLKAEYARVITQELNPAHVKLRDFLKTEYLPHARDSVGLNGMKGGELVYRQQIESLTTLPLEPDYVHNLGLSEVARIRAEMEAIKAKVGFQGTLAEFFEHIRTDPKFKPASREALTEGYYAIGKKVDARISEQFAVLPKTPLEIRAVEPYREKTEAGGSYQQGLYDPKDPSKTRPGIFYFNAYDLPSRTTPGMETLYLHEGAPGHHFQISLAQENEALPAFMRFGGNTAYVEGWGLYAESLWQELGMETDPYQRYGGLDDEMLRAMRLVVDTGIHAKGWGRDQAIQYMLDNSSMGRTDATAEVERYIAWPGQALAYKIGALKMLELKAKAQKALGAKFDPREFHAQLLMTGALPMTVLEKKIDDWIAVRKGA